MTETGGNGYSPDQGSKSGAPRVESGSQAGRKNPPGSDAELLRGVQERMNLLPGERPKHTAPRAESGEATPRNSTGPDSGFLSGVRDNLEPYPKRSEAVSTARSPRGGEGGRRWQAPSRSQEIGIRESIEPGSGLVEMVSLVIDKLRSGKSR